ncbi:MAG: hypothetical protein KY391_06155 [Actinobacteria bacterium]|nr:hypothetical protein [Actinomycetota bacterium]
MKARATIVAVIAIASSACRPDTVDLRYRYDEPTEHLQYVLTARAQAEWEIGEPGRGSYTARFQVEENIQPQEGGGAIVDVTMTPLDVQEDGLLPPGSEERRFRLELGPNGEKLGVLEVGGVPATELDDDELALIGTYRPPLPLEPVGLGDNWEAREEVTLGSVSQQIATTGVLEELLRNEDGNRVALLSYTGAGPLSHVLPLPQGEATLSGDTSVTIDADLDIDRGVLLRATSTTEGAFDARVIPAGEKAPITGTLELQLELDIREL